MSLHDWIDELCDVLDIEAEVDEALVLDVARVVAHAVERPAAPISTYLLGYAAALRDGSPASVEALAGATTAFAEKWAGDEISPDDFEDPPELADLGED